MLHSTVVRTLCNSLVALAALVVLAAPAAAANYPLEIINIKPVGTDGMTANNRIFRAYPGIEYNIRTAVIGGAYPYTYGLRNAPSGMTIHESTGEIRWPNPQANASPTVEVRDAEGTLVSRTWTITVTTYGFRFIDAVNGRNALGNGCNTSCGTGTIDNPWRTISDMYEEDRARSTYAGQFLYFRSGTYRVTDLPRGSVGSPWERVEFPMETKPVVWMAYPGETPVIDFGYQAGVENAPLIRFSDSNVYIDGFETTRSHIIGFQLMSGGRHNTFRRLRMHDHGPSYDGSNGSHIMMTTNPTPSDYTVIQNCEMYQPVQASELGIKIYSQWKMLIEDNIFHGLNGIELKADPRQYTVRKNTFYNVTNLAIGGNMHYTTTYGEILFNNVRGNAPLALDLNQDSNAGLTHVYRNTFVGRVQVRNVDSSDGPFDIRHNVIINNDGGSRVYQNAVSDPSRINIVDNLSGSTSTNIVDGIGNLTSGYSQYIGTRGHQVGPPIAGPRSARIQ